MTPTFLDNAVNTFFVNAGGSNFLATLCAVSVIIVLLVVILRPFNV
jgi:hypothetical protein